MADLTALEKIIGVTFSDKSLLEKALTHRSFLNENRALSESNEHLEFLGDSVLSIIVSTQLYRRFSSYPEGKLTNLRSLLVKSQTLGNLSRELGLGQFLYMSKGEERSGGRENLSLLADTFEAILGAMYLDSGLDSARKFLERHLFPLIPEIEKKEELMDYKSSLQEMTQDKEKLSPVYRVLSQSGPDHDKTFEVGAYLQDRQLGTGQGKSKQIAEQAAARHALEKYASVK